jgi:hypothetical protein
MRINIGPYKNYYTFANVVDSLFFWQKGYYDKQDRWDYLLKDKAVSWALKQKQATRVFSALHKLFPRRLDIHIDSYDTWSMDNTLALIVAPMLRQLKDTKHGAPLVDDADVPEELRSTSAPPLINRWDVDENHFKRWDWVIDEMIWAFETHVDDKAEDLFFEHPEVVLEEGFPSENYIAHIKVNKEGFAAFQERKANGFKLFGKYYQSLWD